MILVHCFESFKNFLFELTKQLSSPTSSIRNPELQFIHWNIPVLGIQYSMEQETCNRRQGHPHNIDLKAVRREEFYLLLSSPQNQNITSAREA